MLSSSNKGFADIVTGGFSPFGRENSINSQKANTADFNLSLADLALHQRNFLNEKQNLTSANNSPQKTLGIYPQALREQSLLQTTSPKLPTVIVIHKSSNQENRRASTSFLNLWYKHHLKSNFVLIDTEREINYYAMLFLKEYWKGENLRILAFNPNGQLKSEVKDPRDFPRLETDLTRLETEALK